MTSSAIARDASVIVGAGLAGAKAAETRHWEGFDGRLVLVGCRDIHADHGIALYELAAVHDGRTS